MNKRRMLKPFWIVLTCCCPFAAITQDTARVNSDTMFCGDARIIFKPTCKIDSTQNISFVHVHEDETTAVEAATQVLDTVQKYCFVTWQCQQQRLVNFELKSILYHFDPNRIYTATGIRATLKSNNGPYSDSAAMVVKGIADTFVKKYVDSNLLVVALHNNSNAGGLSVNSYKKGGLLSRDAKQVFIHPKQDADDFFYTTKAIFFNLLKSKGFNVVLQDNAKVKDDGSLSIYCAFHKIPYINIEAQDGHLQQQMKMLRVVLGLIDQMKE